MFTFYVNIPEFSSSRARGTDVNSLAFWLPIYNIFISSFVSRHLGRPSLVFFSSLFFFSCLYHSSAPMQRSLDDLQCK